MTDHETLVRIGAEIERLESKREKQSDEARRFLAGACGCLGIGDPSWQPPSHADALIKIELLRQELLEICEAHFPHLLKLHEDEDHDDRQL